MNMVRFVSFLSLFRFVSFVLSNYYVCLLAFTILQLQLQLLLAVAVGCFLLLSLFIQLLQSFVRSFVRSLLLLLVSVLLLLSLSLSLLTSLLRLVGQSGCEHYFVPVLFVLFRSVFVLFFLRSKMEIIYRHIITTTKQTKDLTVFFKITSVYFLTII